ncbi:helix-turn-helix domain-containing protein [Oceanospirillum sp.]|uniref:helix-turn-helix domain-containing protein n=1 Tax=Oceanospirillum sp. TaxID=2021254 RepID=UPI003A919518
MIQDAAFHRIQSTLEYIHNHLDRPLSVESMAEKSCWSRWQFQRVFSHFTGQTVAQYIREIRLSRAAELLLCSRRTQLDIALECGFDSEVSFSRSFRHMFHCTPGQYRRRGKRAGLKTPIVSLPLTGLSSHKPGELSQLNSLEEHRLLQIRVESQPEKQVQGVAGRIQGIFAEQPDFSAKVPQIWQKLSEKLAKKHSLTDRSAMQALGVLDTSSLSSGDTSIDYWACISSDQHESLSLLDSLVIPEQEYAVIPFSGPADLIDNTLQWFICHWLPTSGYRGINRFDLEVYPSGFIADGQHLEMEYWVPVAPE